MKKRSTLLLAAVLVVLTAGAWCLVAARLNRNAPSGGIVDLTERELRLVALPGESTVTLLTLRYDVLSDRWHRGNAPLWLGASKLAELGFDCTVPVTNLEARLHYGNLPSRAVLLVLEYEGDAWRNAPADRRRSTRLFAIDAGMKAD